MGKTDYRLVRDQREHAASELLLAVPGPSGLGDGRTKHPLVRDVGLPFPTFHSAPSSTKEVRIGGRSFHPHRPDVAGCTLVRRPVREGKRRPSPSTKTTGSAHATRRKDGTPVDGGPTPSRMETVRGRLTEQGFPDDVSRSLIHCHRSSTSKVYQPKWEAWFYWCKKKAVDPVNPSLVELTTFFETLFQKGLAVITIKGYRSAINSVLAHYGRKTLLSNGILTKLMQAYGNLRPKKSRIFPAWNLPLVLESLSGPPYEPLGKASLLHLTQKTLFLVALATASRQGELAALTRGECLRFDESWSTATLRLDPEFRAKTQRSNETSKPIVIRALTPCVGKNEPERLQCPIRALRFYLDATAWADAPNQNAGGRRVPLFLPLPDPSVSLQTIKRLTPGKIAQWICSVIRRAYSTNIDCPDLPPAIKAHELRALAVSWAFAAGTPIAEILAAGSWRHKSTFTSHYFRDLGDATSLSTYGPLFLAGVTV